MGQRAAYGAGSAAGMLTEKLGNTGLLKSAYGGSLLKDPALGTLGKLAYSAVSEGAEEFAEGLADPLLKNLTYDPAAVYDDAWLRESQLWRSGKSQTDSGCISGETVISY